MTRYAVVVCAWLFVIAVPAAQREAPAAAAGVSDTLKIVRMYGDASGETHFETLTPPLDGSGGRSEILKGPGTMQFARFAADLKSPWHTTNRRKYLVTISGAGYEIEVTDGTKVQFPPGSILLADDLNSKGHRTRALGGESLIMYVDTDDLPASGRR
jgi:hypothetical protein